MYQCIEEGHKLRWFQQTTKKEGFQGAWFYCLSCPAQSAWISKTNLPPGIDWDLLYEAERPHPQKVPFVKKIDNAKNDLFLAKKNAIKSPTAEKMDTHIEKIHSDYLREKLKNVENHRDRLLVRVERLEAELSRLRYFDSKARSKNPTSSASRSH